MPLPTVVPSRISASWQGGDGKRVGRPPPPPDPSFQQHRLLRLLLLLLLPLPAVSCQSPSKKGGREGKREGGREETPPPPPSSRQEAIDSIDDIAGEGEKRCWEERGGQGREGGEWGGTCCLLGSRALNFCSSASVYPRLLLVRSTHMWEGPAILASIRGECFHQ